MEHVNNLIEKAVSSEQFETPRNTQPAWTPETERLVSGLWVRFKLLFLGKWDGPAGPFLGMDRKPSTTARAWCANLAELTPAQFAAGLREVELRAEKAGSLGAEYWPPSYAEFRGMAKNPTGEPWESQRRRLAGNERISLPANRSRETGAAAMANIRNLMGMAPRNEPEAA